ncbi:hypothetical protein [Wolbachia endosymbiont (group A) of Cheilosia soror]|uniref:hypothetical protein n=2 Tax=Wolbachia endosymbiont (group A) of Cheilosia soror TaxID=2953995 RepID=UPI0021F8F665|nr:hypothetical protein [Wolbachia endosymbiont (group A) of Cheilosia soror]
MYSLSLRPGNSPLSYDNVVGRLQHFGFPPCCYPSYRIPTFILVGLFPTEQYSPSLDALGIENFLGQKPSLIRRLLNPIQGEVQENIRSYLQYPFFCHRLVSHANWFSYISR